MIHRVSLPTKHNSCQLDFVTHRFNAALIHGRHMNRDTQKPNAAFLLTH